MTGPSSDVEERSQGAGPPPAPQRLVLLASPCPAASAVFHALTAAFGEVSVVLEPPLSRTWLARRRARALGLSTTVGQVLFCGLAVPVLGRLARRRIAVIANDHHLDLSSIDRPVVSVPSANSDEARRVLRNLAPTVVVVCGTRILSEETLGCIAATFVNLHAGVAPQYRGVHGGYWALAEGRPDLVGTTVHVVDRGIDTGPILAQATFSVTRADSFATYPYLHLGAGVPLLVSAVGRLLAGHQPEVVPPLSEVGPSRLRSHPTLWGYLATRARRSVA